MDKETAEYLAAMESRLTGRLEVIETKESRLSDRLEVIEAMEPRLMGRIDDAQEAVIDRVRTCETSIAPLVELVRSGNPTMGMIANLLSDLAGRVTDLEKK